MSYRPTSPVALTKHLPCPLVSTRGRLVPEHEVFPAAERHSDILLDCPYRSETTAALGLPEDWAISGLPEDASFGNDFGAYGLTYEARTRGAFVTRAEALHVVHLPRSRYQEARAWYRARSAGDRARIVVEVPQLGEILSRPA